MNFSFRTRQLSGLMDSAFFLKSLKSPRNSSRVKFLFFISKHETANFGNRMLKLDSSDDFENCFMVEKIEETLVKAELKL